MQIAYVEPMMRAWARTRSLLFAPFRARTWFVIGFAAWLASILEGSGGSASSKLQGDEGSLSEMGENALNFFQTLSLSLLVIVLVILAVFVMFALLWISSRMKFVFLDQVVTGAARVKEPWTRYGTQGDSLFIWRVFFSILMFFVAGMLVLALVVSTGIAAGVGWNEISIAAIAWFGSGLLLLVVIPALYVGLFLDAFVAPLMYKHGLSAMDAWGRFLPLLRQHAAHFVLFGIVFFVLNVVVTGAIIMLGIFTCCVGLMLFSLPYLGTVITLPVWVAFRGFSLEYLAQFGEEYRLFPPLATSPPSAPSPPPSIPPTA
jgi:hypothetical protein